MPILNQALQHETYWQAFLTSTRREVSVQFHNPDPLLGLASGAEVGGEGNKTGVRKSKSSLFVAGIEPRSTSRYSNEYIFC